MRAKETFGPFGPEIPRKSPESVLEGKKVREESNRSQGKTTICVSLVVDSCWTLFGTFPRTEGPERLFLTFSGFWGRQGQNGSVACGGFLNLRTVFVLLTSDHSFQFQHHKARKMQNTTSPKLLSFPQNVRSSSSDMKIHTPFLFGWLELNLSHVFFGGFVLKALCKSGFVRNLVTT